VSKISPQRFGKYILLRRIALGGMAEIFKAKVAGAEGFEKELVIKRILSHFSEDESFIQMFIDEARLTAKLTHPNIVQIFDFDVVEGSYYIAMEYIEGKDLKDVLEQAIKQKDPLSVAQCVWLAMEIAKGLYYAHTKDDKGQPLNIVHRDVTPSNVMISYRGDVKLMDFGIAKAAQRSTKTQAGAVKGKVAYMSPEQARGKPLDGRSDLFALGVMVWEMLTGRRLFLAESDFETLNNVLKLEPPAPSSLNPDVPSDLDPIILKCLEKDPNKRYPNVDAFGRELTRWFYSNVVDLEKEKLKPLMYRLFKRDIDANERMANDDEQLAPSGQSFNAESTNMMEVGTGTGSGGPVSEQSTRMDMKAAEHYGRDQIGGTEGAGRRVATGTVQRPRAGTRTGSVAYTGPVPARKKGSLLPWLLLILVLIGAGTTVAILMMQKGSTGPTSEPDTAVVTSDTGASAHVTSPAEADAGAVTPPKETAKLLITVTPHTAKVTVEGEPVDQEKDGLELGAYVRVVAESPEYKRFEKIIEIKEKTQVVDIVLEKEGVPTRVVIKPADDKGEVFVDDKRLGLGVQSFEGIVGQSITIKVVPSAGGDAITKTVVLDGTTTLVNVATPGETLIALDPPSATLKATPGVVEVRNPGLVAVKGVDIGASFDIVVSAPGYKTLEQKVDQAQGQGTLALKLEKEGGAATVTPPCTGPDCKKPPVSGKGSLAVNARPWAQVTVNGKAYGTTPVNLKDLPAGKYTIIFTKGAQKATRTVSVGGGKQTAISVDFTTL